MALDLDIYGTLVAAAFVLLLGRQIIVRSNWLRTYAIPEPVVGGLVVALLLWLAKGSFDWQVNFDMSLSSPFMLAFFSTVGLTSNLKSLLAGGKPLVKFLLVVIVLLLLQNVLGIGLSKIMGIDPLIGLLAGSVTMTGGHGTGAAWGQVFSSKYGLNHAIEIAMACATFGLVFGGLIGGPVARYLVKNSPTPPPAELTGIEQAAFESPGTERRITSRAMIECLSMVFICLMAGNFFAGLLKGTNFELPTFVCCLFTGVVINNALSLIAGYDVFERAVSVVGNVSLSLFLAMALMSLKLWQLSALALPMLVILFAQAGLMAFYAIFVTYRAMGSNYDAAVLAAGHCGFGLGATPTAIANMQSVTDRFGPSHLAFLVVPMVGAFFIDLINALAIRFFLELPIFVPLALAGS